MRDQMIVYKCFNCYSEVKFFVRQTMDLCRGDFKIAHKDAERVGKIFGACCFLSSTTSHQTSIFVNCIAKTVDLHKNVRATENNSLYRDSISLITLLKLFA